MKLTSLPKAYGKNIIVRLDKPDNTTDGGIILTGNLSKFATAEVVSVPEAYAPELFDESEEELTVAIGVGERVMFYGNLFGTFEFKGDIYAILKYSEVVAKL
jgi:co-chaperonin GroES (HSP10)